MGFSCLRKPGDEAVFLIFWSACNLTGPTEHPHISGAVASGQTKYFRALNMLDFLFIDS